MYLYKKSAMKFVLLKLSCSLRVVKSERVPLFVNCIIIRIVHNSSQETIG